MRHRAALAVVLVACVPASEELPPAGAAGYVTAPSPASRGEPFVTADGWTMRIDDLALQVSASASPTSFGDDAYGGGSELFRWNAKDEVAIYVPGLSTGVGWFVALRLRGTFRFDNDPNQITSYGIADPVAIRFAPDVNPAGSGRRRFEGPAFVLVARGERAGRTVRIDVAMRPFRGFGNGTQFGPSFTVRKDALAAARLGVAAENLFAVGGGVLGFDAFASADADADGVVTEAELVAVPAACPKCFNDTASTPTNPALTTVTTLADVLAANARTVLQP